MSTTPRAGLASRIVSGATADSGQPTQCPAIVHLLPPPQLGQGGRRGDSSGSGCPEVPPHPAWVRPGEGERYASVGAVSGQLVVGGWTGWAPSNGGRGGLGKRGRRGRE